jgi:hypothetical protein
MDEHLIFFIDILGFREAVSTWEKEKIEMLTELLRDFASLRSEPAFSQTPVQEGLAQVQLTPAVTTFSDHIVMSYPTGPFRTVMAENSLTLGLIHARSQVGALAAAAARVGLLIRGGVTVGPLYHSGGVLLGEAMNEAYYLESRVSIYPRLAVSRKVYSQIGSGHLVKDGDGITHFDYFKEMILQSGNPPGEGWGPRLRARFAEMQQIIENNIDRFERAERWSELAKWVWFKNRFEEARAGLPDAFFRE